MLTFSCLKFSKQVPGKVQVFNLQTLMLKSEVALQNCWGLSKVCCPHTKVRSKLIVIPIGGIILLWALGRVWCCNTYKPNEK